MDLKEALTMAALGIGIASPVISAVVSVAINHRLYEFRIKQLESWRDEMIRNLINRKDSNG